MTYVEAEAVETSRFHFHRKRTGSTAYASTSLFQTITFVPEIIEVDQGFERLGF